MYSLIDIQFEVCYDDKVNFTLAYKNQKGIIEMKRKLYYFIAIAFCLSLVGCGNGPINSTDVNNTNSSNSGVVKEAKVDTYYKNLTVDDLSITNYGSYENIYITLSNKGDKNIDDITLWYDFLDADKDIVSKEVGNIYNGKILKAHSSADVGASYHLEDVYYIRVNSIDYVFEDGNRGSYQFDNPIIFSIEK